MGNYFETIRGFSPLQVALEKKNPSETINHIQGLLLSQMYLDLDWCQVYYSMEVLQRVEWSSDLIREGAKASIFEYINLYAGYCNVSFQKENCTMKLLFTLQ